MFGVQEWGGCLATGESWRCEGKGEDDCVGRGVDECCAWGLCQAGEVGNRLSDDWARAVSVLGGERGRPQRLGKGISHGVVLGVTVRGRWVGGWQTRLCVLRCCYT